MPDFPLSGSRSTFRHPFPRGFIDRARVMALIEPHWKLNRSPVNPDTDVLAAYLAQATGGRVIEAAAGSECLTWHMPRRWNVRKGLLKRKDGSVVADYADNPLHLWSHSVPFTGEVTRAELLAHHIQTDPDRPDEFIYHYRNSFRHDVREWGFSLPWRVVAELDDPVYDVEIDADLDLDGTLKVVDAFLPGKRPETILVMAHTCHPALIADGIGCIAVALEVFHRLKALPEREYSYRFLFGPEYFAAAAWLAHAPKDDVAALHAGIYLDMLTSSQPLGFQTSMQGDSRMDQVFRNVLASHTMLPIEKPYRALWGNDETFYNGPGYNVPTVGMGRLMHREYHYDSDNLDNFLPYACEESAWVLWRVAQVWEQDFVPRVTFTGPLYLSRYGLYIDPVRHPKEAGSLERMVAMMNGRHSCLDIALALDGDFYMVHKFARRMVELGLAEALPRDPRPADSGTGY